MDIDEFNAYVFKNKKDIINEYFSILESEKERIKLNVIKNKNWLENQPVMQDFLNKLQYMLQEKNIGFFSSLITALSNDVISNDEKNAKTINFDLSVKSGMPALKINAKTFENNIEKITSGGLKNVIATGLRVLALWRLTVNEDNTTYKGDFSHRKFLFMDEPDCWVGNQSMPNYAKLLSQLSEHFNLQILIVTHKDVDFFKPYARVYEMQNIGFVDLNLLSNPSVNYESNKEEYIKSIQLTNFKSFKNTEIELDKNLTVIVGKSDTGKSVIMEAFNALINNNSDDDVIRHFENKASIVVNLVNKKTNEQHNNNYSILWERVRKTNSEYPQKVRYRLYNTIDNEPSIMLNDEFNSYDTPDFIVNILKMKKMDSIDIHLGLQDDMTFLFNPKISDQERAKILSLGKESSYIHKMMDDLKSKTREIKSEVKIDEKRYNLLLENLSNLIQIDIDNTIFKKLRVYEDEINHKNLNYSYLENFIQNLLIINNIKQIQFNPINIENKEIFNIENLDIFLNKIALLFLIKDIHFDNEILISDYQIFDIDKVDFLLNKEYLDKIKNINKISVIANEYELFDVKNIDNILTKVVGQESDKYKTPEVIND